MTYVERGGEPVTRHPFDLTGVRLFGFVLQADPLRLLEMCERTFNVPTSGREHYLPIGNHVVLAFTRITSIQSSDAPDDDLGICAEREAAIWVPVFDQRRGRACWTLPYIFVDEPAPMAGGREIFGFPKQLGDVTFPKQEERPDSFNLCARCVAQFEPNSSMGLHQVLSVRRTNAGAAPPQSGAHEWPHLGAGVAAMAQRARASRSAVPHPHAAGGFLRLADALGRGGLTRWIGEARAVGLMLSHMAFGRLPVVLLKQFRDVTDPRRACYQAVVDVEQEVLKFDGGSLLPGKWQAKVEDLDGEPLQRDLGLPARSVADLAFQLDFEFRIRPGTLLWEARR
jgi:hypothetical protein